ncbi:MAG: T9SS type A sorting domain-containing protein, partial [Bacteroidales bacterium]|nr:T9SS type A sorting domain-containing protein [Bacteroidales bacterium]
SFTAGTISSTGQTICSGGTPSIIGSTTAASGGDGTITYSWRSSADSYVTAISGATSSTYTPPSGLTTTTSYRRYAKDGTCSTTPTVSTGTWTVTVHPNFAVGAINTTGQTICAGDDPTLISNSTLASGGFGTITYEWRANGIPIASSNSATYDPPAGLTVTTAYTRWAKDNTCNTTFAQSAGTWTVTVRAVPMPSGIGNGDFYWTGAEDNSWDNENNWLYYNGSYSVATSLPLSTSNVYIESYASVCGLTNAITEGNSTVYCQDLNIGSGLTLGGLSTIEITGDWNNEGIFTAGTGTVTFNGTSPQTITTNGETFNNVVINNTGAGNADIIVATDLRINGMLALTNGVVSFTYPNRKVALTNSANSTDGNTNSFVAGIVEKTGTSAFTFPVGRDGVWAPVSIAAPAAVSTITAEYKTEPGPLNWSAAYMCDQNELHHTSGVEHWLLTTNASTPAVTLYWTDGVRSGIEDLADLTVAHYNVTNSCWENKGGSLAGTSTTSLGSITSTVPFGSYSPITFGTKTKDNPLPVELLDFNANCLQTSANIHWQTATETNNDYYILERSNGVNEFYEIARLQGAGNSNILADYYFVDDNMFSGDNYYRLKQVDFDGKTTTFNIITLNCDGYVKEQAIMYAYPNPFKDEINVVIENMDAGEFTLEILDDLGRVVYLERHTATSSEFRTSLNLSDLRPAVYNLRSKSEENVLNIRVVKK